MTALVWIRNDLRLADNPALFAAAEHEKVMLVFIHDPNQRDGYGAAQYWWLHHSLKAYQQSLHKHYHATLNIFQGHPLAVLKTILSTHKVDAIYWNRSYLPTAIQRDKEIKAYFSGQKITTQSFKGNLLLEPWQISTQQNQPFKVFTPFWKQASQTLINHEPQLLPRPSCLATVKLKETLSLEDLKLLPCQPDWSQPFHRNWSPGEEDAHRRFQSFQESLLPYYAKDRDTPSQNATSRLSPYLHFGEMTARQIWHAIQNQMSQSPELTKAGEKFLAEVGWREFSYHLLYHYPSLSTQNFKSEFNQFPWQTNEAHFKAWTKGLTGYPLVDAGMRELWHTGYMHNRIRMITASFLTKHLLLPWQKGAEWFWYTLLDADCANNNASWQWVAGCGADAAPYFRIFNPILQGEKFDPEGQYVKKWVPELQALPTRYIHQPWQASKAILKQAGIDLGETYPAPIVDHGAARQRALTAYEHIKK